MNKWFIYMERNILSIELCNDKALWQKCTEYLWYSRKECEQNWLSGIKGIYKWFQVPGSWGMLFPWILPEESMSARKIRQPKWPERHQHVGWCFSLNGSLWKKSRKKANRGMYNINGYKLLQQTYSTTIKVAGDNWE